MIIDTHAHLNDSVYKLDRDKIIKKSLEKDIWMINIGFNLETSKLAIEIGEGYENGVFASVALHPQNIKEIFDADVYKNLLLSKKVVAIGETGLDFNETYGILSEGDKKLQEELFKKHIELALQFNKPIIIHCSKAHDRVLEILNSYFLVYNSKLRGVAHSFLGNYKQARKYRELGFKIAFNGIITYARDYDRVILETPIEDILIETDCPYLTPIPYRGERNEPLYVIEVAKKIAELKNISLEDASEKTTENAKILFGV